MIRSTRFVTLNFSFIVILLSSGCAHVDSRDSNSLTAKSNTSNNQVPEAFLHVSNDVKKHFRYDNSVKPSWPPHVDLFGNSIGNCMTYSRMIRHRLDALGYSVRYRNVLAPTAPREHVVAVATDLNGKDWVFDNRYARPYLQNQLMNYYEIESFRQSAQVGAQRHRWIATNRTSSTY